MPLPSDAPKKIRDKMDTGVLPRETPAKMYTGFGSGELCDGCETTIFPAQTLYKFDASDGRVIRFHVGCAGLWEGYRRIRGWSKPPA